MKKLLYQILVFVSFLLLSASSCNSSTEPPTPGGGDEPNIVKPDMKEIYDFVQSYQLKYIKSLVVNSGAFKDNESSDKITPYFTHFGALALITDPTSENLTFVENYIKWYLSKLNGKVTPFHNDEIEGSVYDYFLPDETSKGTYDSVDSYAALFLEIAMRFAKCSDEAKQWLSQYSDKITLVFNALVSTIDYGKNSLPGENSKDYLSIAHYRYPLKYLMDNSEVNLGLKAALWLKNNNLIETSVDINSLIVNNKKGIETLYNETNNNYDYAKGNPSDWNKFYPGAVAQLYPCLFGALSPAEMRSKQLYEKFNSIYPEWHTGKTYSTHPWTMIVYAASVMRDKERVDNYINHIYSLNMNNQQKPHWYITEAGCLVLAIENIKSVK